jgi:regulator of protease activity HflC (stomatin/prohibitin superfamily)
MFTGIGGLALTVGGYVLVNHCMYNVEGGHRAVIYSRLSGMSDIVKGEGTHFKLPWLQRPYIYNVRSTPRNIKSLTGSRDLQMVDINLRIIYRYTSRPAVIECYECSMRSTQYLDAGILSLTTLVLLSVPYTLKGWCARKAMGACVHVLKRVHA